MPVVDVQELQRYAAALVRRAAAGESVTIAVDGREIAELTALRRKSWRTGAEIAAIFDGPADPDRAEDRKIIDGRLGDVLTNP